MNEQLSRKERLELAIRENRGTELHPDFLQKVAAALKRRAGEIQLVDLRLSDEIRSRLRDRWRLSRTSRPGVEYIARTFLGLQEFASFCQDRESTFPEEVYYVFLPESHWCGAVRMERSMLLAGLPSLLTLDQDDVWASTYAGEAGMVCEMVSEDTPIPNRPVINFESWIFGGT